MLMTLSNCSRPTISAQGAGSSPVPLMVSAAWRLSVSFTSVDLPEPDTPVTQVMRPSGMSTLTPLRLLPLAPRICNWRAGSFGVRCSGTAMVSSPLKYLPVSEAGVAITVDGVPCATIAPLLVRDKALEVVGPTHLAAAFVQIGELDLLVTAAVEDALLDRARELRERRLDVETVMPRQRLQHVEVIQRAPVPAADRAAREAQVAVDHNARGVEELFHAESVAGRAGAGRIVERKQARLELGEAVAADRAGEFGGEDELFALGIVDEGHARDAVAHLERGLDGVGEALLDVRAHLEAIDHHLDAVLLAEVEFGWRVELEHLAVDAGPHIPLRTQLFQQLVVFALALLHHRGEQHEARAFGQREYLIHHLAHGLRRAHDVMRGAAWLPGARKQQSQVIVNLGHRADGRARGVRGRFLFDRDRGRKPLDVIDIGLFHHR